MQLINAEGILPGMPFKIFKDNLEEIKKEFKQDIGDKLETNERGIIIKADSLGSLEALMTLLKQERIDIIKAGIGQINKKDLISAETNFREDPTNAVIVGFNVEEDDEVKDLMHDSKVEVLKNEVIYKIIEDLVKFKEEVITETWKHEIKFFLDPSQTNAAPAAMVKI